jgi:flavin-binding protein dodecin
MVKEVKKIEITGKSEISWEDAAQNAVNEARKITRHLRKLEVLDMTATIGGMGGKIMQYLVRILVQPVGE